ncbi:MULTISPECIES: hypothetical protein [Dietzia]|uniref:hypothetical protein n=1 Tax=Dietzia TaxID=37914 RepID=UPI0013EE1938|nr:MULTISPECIES: hypothetical protein [Dietzia]MCT1710451.1 hypothetical protein [Dietzia cinnamea]MCT2273321.1 hypothetical protein [Dietzia cinnamea]
MQSWTTPRLQESGVSLHWPVAGVIALWALVLRDRAEYCAYVVVTTVVLTVMSVWTGLGWSESFVLALANLIAGVITRWVALALVPVGRGVDSLTRYERAPIERSVRENIGRLATPYDVLRLFTAAFVGAAVGWTVAAVALTLDGTAPAFTEGVVWVLRNLANVLWVTGTGLAPLWRRGERRRASVLDVAVAYGATTVTGVIAFVLSPYLPLALLILVPLFWSGVRSSGAACAPPPRSPRSTPCTPSY